jgi:hypothetical protein
VTRSVRWRLVDVVCQPVARPGPQWLKSRVCPGGDSGEVDEGSAGLLDPVVDPGEEKVGELVHGVAEVGQANTPWVASTGQLSHNMDNAAIGALTAPRTISAIRAHGFRCSRATAAAQTTTECHVSVRKMSSGIHAGSVRSRIRGTITTAAAAMMTVTPVTVRSKVWFAGTSWMGVEVEFMTVGSSSWCEVH